MLPHPARQTFLKKRTQNANTKDCFIWCNIFGFPTALQSGTRPVHSEKTSGNTHKQLIVARKEDNTNLNGKPLPINADE